MAYQPHTLITFGGSLTEASNNDEIWECGVRGFNDVDGAPVDPGQLQAVIDDICTRGTGNLADWFSAAGSHHAATAQLRWGKAVNIGADGSYSSDPAMHEFSPGVAGLDNTQMPTFCCVVYGWTTGRSFGRARFGRIYPPNCGAPVNNGTATITTTAQDDLATAAVALIATLTVELSEAHFTPYVVSKSGVSNPITGVRIPSVIDVQRRRKNASRPQYVSEDV